MRFLAISCSLRFIIIIVVGYVSFPTTKVIQKKRREHEEDWKVILFDFQPFSMLKDYRFHQINVVNSKNIKMVVNEETIPWLQPMIEQLQTHLQEFSPLASITQARGNILQLPKSLTERLRWKSA